MEIEETSGYQASYSQLNFARSNKQDPFQDVADGRSYFILHLAKLSKEKPGLIPTQLATLQAHYQEALQKYCAQSGVQLV